MTEKLKQKFILLIKKIKEKRTKRLAPGRVIAIGFATVIFVGAMFLFIPLSHNPKADVSFTDAVFTSTSAVCVTGLVAIDTADNFNGFGQAVVAMLIQIGGLGITSIGVGLIILSGKKIGIRERTLAKEALNYSSFKGVLALVKSVLKMTFVFELTGALLSLIVFSNDYPLGKAIWMSVFHSIAAFNNSGFDIIGGFQNLIPYQDNVLLNLVTCGLIIFGGLGFFVIRELYMLHSFKKFSLHTKIVLCVTAVLLIGGTLFLKLTDDVTLLEAFFTSTSARTAGFSTFPIGDLSNAGLLILIVLMFIGASPGSTGGGIKTTTAFILLKSMISTSANKSCGAFKKKFPEDIVHRSFVLLMLALSVVIFSSFMLSIFEPQTEYMKLLFETVSAFGTVGLSTGITPTLSDASKWVLIITMYIGRLGPLTVASLLVYNSDSRVSRPQEPVTIG